VKQPETDDTQPSLLSRTLRIGHKPIGFKVARGALSSVLRKAIVAPISLLLVPFTLYKVGVAGYGTWAILSTIINLVWLMDPGLGPTVTKYVAEYSGSNDIDEIRRILDATCAICLFMSAIASCVVWFCSGAIIKELFRGPTAPPVSEIMSLWPLVLLCIVVFLMAMPTLAVINGRQRMDLTNALFLAVELFSSFATVVLLLLGEKVRGLLIGQLLGLLLMLVGGLVIGHRLLPSVTPNPFRCKLATLRKIVSFSVPLYAGYVMTTLQGQLERLYLARFVGIVPVGWYSVASQGAVKIKRLPDMLLGPVLAAASELDASKERRRLEELHFRTHKYLALVAIPLVVFSVVTAKTLVRLWVGGGLDVIAFTFAVLVIGNLFPQMSSPTYFVMVGRGILRPAVYTALLTTLLNIVLSYIFISRWGFAGAAMGTAIPMIVSTIYFFVAYKPYFETPLYQTLGRAYLKPLLCSVVAVLVVPGVGLLKLHMWEGLMIEMIAFGTIYLFGLKMVRFFDRFDLDKIEAHMPFLVQLWARFVPAGIMSTGIDGVE
jgi:O-antigen/teichoic acid export membrane protein